MRTTGANPVWRRCSARARCTATAQPMADAESAKKKLEEAGAKAEIK